MLLVAAVDHLRGGVADPGVSQLVVVGVDHAQPGHTPAGGAHGFVRPPQEVLGIGHWSLLEHGDCCLRGGRRRGAVPETVDDQSGQPLLSPHRPGVPGRTRAEGNVDRAVTPPPAATRVGAAEASEQDGPRRGGVAVEVGDHSADAGQPNRQTTGAGGGPAECADSGRRRRAKGGRVVGAHPGAAVDREQLDAVVGLPVQHVPAGLGMAQQIGA